MGALPNYSISMRCCKPKSYAYMREPRTIGDHIRKCRLDHGLEQKAIAQRMGVCCGTIWNWEAGEREPEFRYMPAIIAWLGYDPRPMPQGFPGRLRWLRTAKGWDFETCAKILGVDPSTLTKWERGEHEPNQGSQQLIDGVFRL
jgi:transcriptional regulator with XRE-family HTH domain